MINNSSYRCWAEIDLSALRENLAWIRHQVGLKAKIMTVVKADAYGHGLKEIASHLMNCGTNAFGIANLKEAHDIRTRGEGWPILMLGACIPGEMEYAIQQNVMVTVSTPEEVSSLSRIATQLKKQALIQIKIDTGMGRLGVDISQAYDFIKQTLKLQNSTQSVAIKGIYTHLAAVEDDEKFTQSQLTPFRSLVDQLRKENISLDYIHASSSGGILFENNDLFNTFRPGLITYGIAPSGVRNQTAKIQKFLVPALSLKTRVSLVKNISAGKTLSYGHTFVAPGAMRIATLTAGYGDGYHRAISGRGSVLIHEKMCPILGRITMDQMIVDVSSVEGVSSGDEAVLIGKQGKEEITAALVAEWADTIPWEVLTSISHRVRRIYLGITAS